MKKILIRAKQWLSTLSFRTGIVVLVLCVCCYIISFAQLALPMSTGLKAALWTIFFGLAKTFQYSGLAIIGAKGVERLRTYWKGKKKNEDESIEQNVD